MSSRNKISFDSITSDDIITYSIALMMGLMFFDHTNTTVIFCYFVAMVAWISKWVREKRIQLEWNIVGVFLFIILVNALLSSIYSYDVKYSFREVRGEILKMIPFYFLVLSNIKTTGALKKILYAIFTGAFVMSVIGVVGYFTGYTMYRDRTVSLYANESYTSLGFYLLLTSCLLLGMVTHEDNKKRKIIHAGLIIVYLACILATLTRSIWLGFFSAVLITSFFHRKKLILLFPVIVLVLFLLLPSAFTNRFKSIFDFQSYGRPGGALSDRVQLWESATDMIRDYPFLGVGYGKRIFKKVYITEGYILSNAQERRALPNAHNLYLDIAVQLGIPGLFIFLAMIALYFKEAIISYKNAEDSYSKGVVLGCILGVYQLLQIGLTGNLFYDENGMYIIFLMAVSLTFKGDRQSKIIMSTDRKQTYRDNQRF